MPKFVVATDLSSRSTLAVGRAIALAQSLEADLTVLHVSETSERAVLAAATAQMGKDLADVMYGDVSIELKVLCGDPCEIIVQFAEIADLLILGEPREHTLREFFIGSTAHRIMRRISTPGLMVRTEVPKNYHHVVFAVDFSDESIRAIDAALKLGLATNHCTAVHVYDSARIDLMVKTSSYSMKDIKNQIASEAAKIENKLARLMKRLGLRGRPVAVLAKTSSASTLLAYAQTLNADLIILGSRGRSNIAKITLGSVAEETLINAMCDILIVPGVTGFNDDPSLNHLQSCAVDGSCSV